MLGGAIKSLQVGVGRRWQTGIVQALSVVGTIWLITEITSKVSDQAEHWVKDHGNYYIAIVLVGAAIWFIKYIYEVRSVSFNLPTTNTKIEIRYGDLFEAQTD
jgi:membrane protein DedA with SNARE-associated domain